MDVLIVTASRHGSTAEIADAVARRLESRGPQVDATDPVTAPGVEGYDAVIVGSAVYMGKWLNEAVAFVNDNAKALADRPVWLFSSGPLDEPESEAMPTQRIDHLVETTGALGHHVFSGRLDRDDLSWTERLVTRIVQAPDGDFRDWDDVSAWADTIADELETQTTTG